MKLGVAKEIESGEHRVALVPQHVAMLTKLGHEVLIEHQAGGQAGYLDQGYIQSGARIVTDAQQLFDQSDLVLKVRPPGLERTMGRSELDMLRDGTALMGFMDPWAEGRRIEEFIKKNLTVFAAELVPRITRAQSMDVLSSMATLAGYKAVLLGASRLGKLMPLMMTAAGTLAPAAVLVLGAGVAGLQAIATAKRLGAKVEAFDTRAAVKEQVESLGANFVSMEFEEDAEASGGYAKEMSAAFIQKEMETIGARLPKTDLLITTAQVFGKKSPLLVTNDMLAMMPPGGVVVDLAAEGGGNCEATRVGEEVWTGNVLVMGPKNLPATVANHASQMLSVNYFNLFRHLYGTEQKDLDLEDQITRSVCLCRQGKLVSPVLQAAMS